MTDDFHWSPHSKPAIPRQREAGGEVWRLHDGRGQIMTCEVIDQTDANAGFDVRLTYNEELILSRRCVDADSAAYVADAWRKDQMSGGWREQADDSK